MSIESNPKIKPLWEQVVCHACQKITFNPLRNMKNSNDCQTSAHLFQANMNWAKVLCRMSIVAALALVLPNQARAQTVNWLYFPFTDAPGSNTTVSSTSLGGISGVTLTGYNGGGTQEDFHGAVGSGVDGVENGGRALSLTNGDG